VLEHLEKAQANLHRAWGMAEWSRLANTPVSELSPLTQKGFAAVLGEETLQQIYPMTLNNLDVKHRETLIAELGRQALTELYRQLLLAVITELWVDYLTSMEALRVSIGLEAYAQRDPLVQYKNRAFELFQELLGNMRMGVVTRMFTFRPRDLSTVQTSAARPETPKIAEQAEETEESIPQESDTVTEEVGSSLSSQEKEISPDQAGGKKRRRRHR